MLSEPDEPLLWANHMGFMWANSYGLIIWESWGFSGLRERRFSFLFLKISYSILKSMEVVQNDENDR